MFREMWRNLINKTYTLTSNNWFFYQFSSFINKKLDLPYDKTGLHLKFEWMKIKPFF